MQYIRSVVTRTMALSKHKDRMKTPLDLSDMFNPEAFLSALRHQSARYVNLYFMQNDKKQQIKLKFKIWKLLFSLKFVHRVWQFLFLSNIYFPPHSYSIHTNQTLNLCNCKLHLIKLYIISTYLRCNQFVTIKKK